ncbi:MAG: phosphotransferase [Lachnospiraceae bacterium]|nr:phosphotransferase [Lachnospiraceae bacterium]
MHITDLGGHSGCKILLCEDFDKVFVRKISGSKEYNSRLEIQAKKQAKFKGGIVKAPKVYDCGYTNEGLFFFDMEYIRGITLSEYISRMEIGKIKGFVDALLSSVLNIDGANEVDITPFVKKIDSLKKTLYGKTNTIVDHALDILDTHDWNLFKKSFCHGDMTLENIIIKGDKVYLIDFLDSFYDSWLIDAGTLLQDVLCMWSYRYQEFVEINTVIRLRVFKDILVDSIHEKMGKSYIEIYYALLLKLIRIYPYCKDETTYNFLNNKTSAIITIIEKGGD